MQVRKQVITAVSMMSPEEREEFYLNLADYAEQRGNNYARDWWLHYAVKRSRWDELVCDYKAGMDELVNKLTAPAFISFNDIRNSKE